MFRDFTYIDDVTEMIYKLINLINEEGNLNGRYSNTINIYKRSHIFNIGNSNMISLLEFIEKIENKLGLKSKKNHKRIPTRRCLQDNIRYNKIKRNN